MTTRTPQQHREIYNEWRANAPANDSAIFRTKPRKASPRHAKLAKELAGLLVWRRLSDSTDPLATNWCVPANDNEPETENNSTECKYEIRPTVDELMTAVALGGIEYGQPKKAAWPLSGEVRPISRLGGLSFATEFATRGGTKEQVVTRGSLISWSAKIIGKERKPSERFGTPKGATAWQSEDVKASNSHFAALLGTQPHRYIRPKRAAPSSLTTDGVHVPKYYQEHYSPYKRPALPKELRGDTPLAEARAWAGLPPVTVSDERPALPCGSMRVVDSFIGHHVHRDIKRVEASSPPNISLVTTQTRTTIRQAISPDDVKALDGAQLCKSFRELGELFGHNGKAAERCGKKRTLAAARNLTAVLQKDAA